MIFQVLALLSTFAVIKTEFTYIEIPQTQPSPHSSTPSICTFLGDGTTVATISGSLLVIHKNMSILRSQDFSGQILGISYIDGTDRGVLTASSTREIHFFSAESQTKKYLHNKKFRGCDYLGDGVTLVAVSYIGANDYLEAWDVTLEDGNSNYLQQESKGGVIYDKVEALSDKTTVAVQRGDRQIKLYNVVTSFTRTNKFMTTFSIRDYM